MIDRIIETACYARGFLLATQDDVAAENWGREHAWGRICLSGYDLHHDPRTEAVAVVEGGSFVCLVGEVVDLDEDTADKQIIAKNILTAIPDESHLLDYIDTLCGRFVIVFGDGKSATILQDATGMRACYYGERYVASHYGLINELEDHPHIQYWETYDALPYSKKPWYLPGDLTPYESILTLIPHHSLDLKTHVVKRVFPRRNRVLQSAPDVANYFAQMMRRQIEILSRKYRFLVSMTGGNDSRTTFSALKGFQDRTILFSYLNGSTRDTCAEDNAVAAYLANTFGFEFRQLPLTNAVPDKLQKALSINHYHRHIPRAVYEIARQLPLDGYIHLRSNILESIRERHYFCYQKLTPEVMSRNIYGCCGLKDEVIQKAWRDFYVRNQYEQLYDYDPGDLFYEEFRMGVWHSGGILLSYDVVFDTYCLFNQGKLLDMGMCMPTNFRRSNYLVERAAELLWPEVMFKCPNSSKSLLNLKSSVKPFGVGWENVKVDSSGCTPYLQQCDDAFEIGFASDAVDDDARVELDVPLQVLSRGGLCSLALAGSCTDMDTASRMEVAVALDGDVKRLYLGSDLKSRYRTVELEMPKGSSGHELAVRLTCRRSVAGQENSFILKVFSPSVVGLSLF